MKGDLLQVLALGIETPDVVGVIAFREEIDLAFVPHRIGMPFAVGLRGLDQGKVLEVENPDGLCLSAPIVAPLGIPEGDGLVGGVLAVFRNFAKSSLWNRQHFFKATLYRNAVKLIAARRHSRPTRAKKHRFAVGHPALYHIDARVPGQAFGCATFGRQDKYIGIAIVLSGKGDAFPIG